MWVSQTYLGDVGTKAKLYVYYFFEDYARQDDIKADVKDRLGQLGYSFGGDVSVFVPQSEYIGLIRREMRTRFQKFWWKLQGMTPGLLIITKPLSSFDPSKDESVYLSLGNELVKDDAELTSFFQELHAGCEDIIGRHLADLPCDRQAEPGGLLAALYASLQLKIPLGLLTIDLKPLILHFRNYGRDRNRSRPLDAPLRLDGLRTRSFPGRSQQVRDQIDLVDKAPAGLALISGPFGETRRQQHDEHDLRGKVLRRSPPRRVPEEPSR